MFRIVTAEVAGIYDDSANDSGQAEPDDAPVVAARATSPAFPTIHPFTAIGIFTFAKDGCARFQEILLGREEIVVREQHTAAEFF
jgi:hypothetical protein